MKLLALQAVKRMNSLLIGRISRRDTPFDFWLKGQPGATLSLLQDDLYYMPSRATVKLHPTWKELWP